MGAQLVEPAGIGERDLDRRHAGVQGVEPRENWQQGVELTIEQITDWEDLTLAVHALSR